MCINPVDNTKRTRLSLYLEAMEPPPVHYTPSTHYTQPPAVVQQHQLFSPKFITYIKTVENVAKKGFKNNKWYPITISSTERNIGYGHKINPGENFDKGLLDKQVEELLTQDLVSARIKAKASINAKYGQGVFERLDITRQEMLIDFIFNIGTLNSHPKFVKHLINNDLNGMKQEYERSAVMNGVRKPLTGRNAAFFNTFLKNYKGGFYTSPTSVQSRIAKL
jgi:GH24 family phage-related lysozyme (muramidase)